MRILVPVEELEPVPTKTWPGPKPPAAAPHPVQPTKASSPARKPAPVEPAGTPTRFYTYKNEVPLKPGQILGFTPGKGYYAKVAIGRNGVTATTAPVEEPPPEGSEPATKPRAAAPDSKPKPVKRASEVKATKHAIRPQGRYYTFREDVPLGPHQKIGFRSGKGYYAMPATAAATRAASGKEAAASAQRLGGAVEGPVKKAKSRLPNKAESTPPRSLQTAAAGPIPGAANRREPSGFSNKHVTTHPISPSVRVVVTQQASATVSWSGGEGKPSVTLSPHGDVSVSGQGVSFTDRGILNRLAEGWKRDLTDAAHLVVSSEDEFSSPVRAPSFDVSVRGEKRTVTIGEVTDTASLAIDEGAPAFEIGASTSFSVSSPSGSILSVKYSVTTTFRVEGRPNLQFTAEDVEIVLASAAGIAMFVGARRAGTSLRTFLRPGTTGA